MKKEFSGKIKYIGFIMTCFIVLHHCPDLNDSFCLNSLDLSIKHLFDYSFVTLAYFGLYWFFAITGFLLFKDYSMEKYPGKLKKRIFSLFIPYLLWLSLCWVIDIIQGQSVFSIKGFLTGAFLFVWPNNIPMWYIYVVFILAVLSPALYYILKRKNLGWFVILAIIFTLKLLSSMKNPTAQKIVSYGYVSSIIKSIPAYLAGAFYGFHYKDGKTEGLYYLLTAFLMALVFDDWLTGFFADTVVQLMPIAILYLFPPINIPEKLKDKKYVHIYKLSFLVYVLHAPVTADLHALVLNVYMKTVARISMSASLALITMSFAFLLASIAAAALIYWALSKKAPRLLALLTGGRS